MCGASVSRFRHGSWLQTLEMSTDVGTVTGMPSPQSKTNRMHP